MSRLLALDPDAVRVAELRLFAARTEFRDAADEHERARQLLIEAHREYRRLADADPLARVE